MEGEELRGSVHRRGVRHILGPLGVAAVIAFAMIAASSAAARSGNYWGFNNLSASNPPAGQACSVAGVGGWACTGFNNWDQSDADWRGGHGAFVVGFICGDDGLLWGAPHGGYEGFGVYAAWWSTYCPFTHYNRVAVAHREPSPYGSYNYLQAIWRIWP